MEDPWRVRLCEPIMRKPLRSERTAQLVQSDIRAMTRACQEVGGVNLGQGICDVPAPEVVRQAAKDAIDAHQATYTRYDGIAPLREAIASKLSTFNHLSVNPENEVIVTVGATGALAATLAALLDPGDELLTFEPFYGYHRNTAHVAQVKVNTVPLGMPGFSLDMDALEAARTSRTRALLVNTPSNPSGKVFTRAELDALASFCDRHDLLCITDEIYEYITFDASHISMASLPGMRDRTVTIGGYSKTFSITGWRIGYIAAPAALAAPIALVNDLHYVCAPAPLQVGVAAGIQTLDASYYTDLAEGYRRKRDRFCSVLTSIGLTPHVPQGAYYVLADISSLQAESAHAAAMRLLHEARVASVPGSAFFEGGRGEHLTRFCFAKNEDELERACQLLTSWSSQR